MSVATSQKHKHAADAIMHVFDTDWVDFLMGKKLALLGRMACFIR